MLDSFSFISFLLRILLFIYWIFLFPFVPSSIFRSCSFSSHILPAFRSYFPLLLSSKLFYLSLADRSMFSPLFYIHLFFYVVIARIFSSLWVHTLEDVLFLFALLFFIIAFQVARPHDHHFILVYFLCAARMYLIFTFFSCLLFCFSLLHFSFQ